MAIHPILPSAMLGMLGGGQLGRFFVRAAHEMGYKVTVLDPDPDSPAGKIADVHLCVDYQDASALQEIAKMCAGVTIEFENIPIKSLEYLAEHIVVSPSPVAVSIAQNRAREKNFFQKIGLPTAHFTIVEDLADLAKHEHYPAILKTVKFGYDGKGQINVSNQEEAELAWKSLSKVECVLEQKLNLSGELSVIIVRNIKQEIALYPCSENVHISGILHTSHIPAQLPESICLQAQDWTKMIAERLNYIGVLAVEFFLSEGKLFVNEMAPRPHNSGHYTLDACISSQFDQQVRALCNLSLGDTTLHTSALMTNILGDFWIEHNNNPPWHDLLSNPQIQLHLYGKKIPKKGRKMGHWTLLTPISH